MLSEYIIKIGAIVLGAFLIVLTIHDSFETVVLPRRVARRFRLARLFYTVTWYLWAIPARKMSAGNRREYYLGLYGPLSLILLLIVWVILFVFGFAFLQWGLGTPLVAPEKEITFGSYLYLSGTTFFTLGYGDVTPLQGFSRLIAVLESGIGFAFLALIIGYVPVIYQSFSQREVNISLLDARAGSPPSAVELLRRHYSGGKAEELIEYLREWERWCGDLLESHLSYPVLNYYRSQHERQSWVGALTTVLDACALMLVGIEGLPAQPAKFTFAIARHAAVDLAQLYGSPPALLIKRLSHNDFLRLQEELAAAGIQLKDDGTAEQQLANLRAMYEPFIVALSRRLIMPVPNWLVIENNPDDWQTSAWDHFLEAAPHTLDRAIMKD